MSVRILSICLKPPCSTLHMLHQERNHADILMGANILVFPVRNHNTPRLYRNTTTRDQAPEGKEAKKDNEAVRQVS